MTDLQFDTYNRILLAFLLNIQKELDKEKLSEKLDSLIKTMQENLEH
jgi:hypothetical protein